ncbi:Transposase, MuDR, plant [Sesbania bispinosa]|nr:Transposase, MuDR, plant [Sesbania bispinosa]
MEDVEYDEPSPGSVHLLVHFIGKDRVTKLLLNVDPDQYSYFDLVDDIHGLAMADGCKDIGSPFALSFRHPGSSSKIPINTDSDVLDMFKLNRKCTCIHVYASLLNCKDNGVGVGNSEVVVSESDDEWSVGGEYQQDDGLETDYDPSFIVEEERHDENNDELSDYEEKHDLITFEHSDEDKVPIYFDRGMNGKLFVYEPDGKVKLEIGLLFIDVDEFRAALRDFVIQEGFEIKRIKNEKARVTARCAADGCCWRIHASPTPDGKTYKIKTYNHVHSCIRTSKNSNATSPWIANKLESKLKADPNMSYAIMKQELLDKYDIEPSDDEFQVKDGFTTFVVNLRTRACGYNYWRLSGLPCKHACACISYKRANVEMFCDNAYTAKIYCLAYKEIIHPMPELDTNNKGGYGQIDPPTLRRLPGRPRINRKRGVTEGLAGAHDARRSNTVRCSNCNEFGHDILGCQRDQTKKQKKLKVRRRNQMNDASQASASSLNGASSQVTHEFGTRCATIRLHSGSIGAGEKPTVQSEKPDNKSRGWRKNAGHCGQDDSCTVRASDGEESTVSDGSKWLSHRKWRSNSLGLPPSHKKE